MSGPTAIEAVAPLVADPAGSALLFDFDGTLAPIVDDPARARPSPGVADLLDALAGRYRRVGVVSGRPVAFLAAHLPPSVALSGLYGLEWSVDGVAGQRPGTDRWRAVVADAARRAADAGVAGLRVEAKGLSITLHYRDRPAAAGAVEALAEAVATATGLERRPAKRSVELHPPVAADKGLVVRELAAGATGALYVGDDVGDLPAFGALAELRAAGTATVAVAVATAELPDDLRAAADALAEGPGGVVALLRALASGAPSGGGSARS